MNKFDQLLWKVKGKKEGWVPPARLLSLDPGETTGWAIFVDGELHEQGQLRTKEDMWQAVVEFMNDKQPTHIICENYKVYGHKTADHSWSSLHTPQLIGGIKMLAHIRKVSVFLQMANQAKGFCTDDKLKAWGLYQPSMKHARDAVRHGCYFLLFNKEEWYGCH